MRRRLFLASLAIALLAASGNAFAFVLCWGKDDEKPRNRMEIVVPQNQLPAFRKELQAYAQRQAFKFSDWGRIGRVEGWENLEGKNVLMLAEPYDFAWGSVQFNIITTPKNDTFEVEMYTCNLRRDWMPYWRDFQSFAKVRNYRQLAN